MLGLRIINFHCITYVRARFPPTGASQLKMTFSMPRSPVLTLLVAMACGQLARGETPEPMPPAGKPVPLVAGTVVKFASRDEGIAILTARDAFTEQLSKFDLQSRLRTNADVTLADWQKSVAREVLPWEAAEIERLTAALGRLRERLAKFRLPLPEVVLLIRTTGKEEADAAYTRANAIVLPGKMVQKQADDLDSLLLHELFHVLSRHDKTLRRELYAVIGFHLCDPIALPPSLADRKLTNPDAPAIDCYIEMTIDGKPITAAPFLYASAKEYDPQQGGSLFRYLTFRLLVIERRDGKWQAVFHGEQPTVIDPRKLPAYFDQIGKNTGYIIHPDEILADNFVHLVLGHEHLPTPRVIDAMSRLLAK